MKYDLNLSNGEDRVLSTLIATLLDSTREWRENLEAPSVEAIVWQPYEGGYSIGGILLHMIDCEAYWLKTVAEGIESDPSHPANIYNMSMNQYAVAGWPPPPAEPLDWYYELQDSMRNEIVERIINHQQSEKEFQGRHNSYTYQWIVAHIMEHDSYHGGQMVMLHEMWKQTVA